MENLFVNSFMKNFDVFKFEPIALYGVGLNTKYIVEAAGSDYNIRGVYDRDRADGIIYGIDILNIKNIEKDNIKIIVIIAQPQNVRTIFNRITRVIENLDIKVMDVFGEDLNKKFEKDSYLDIDCNIFETSEQLLLSEIKKHDVISFDIFDTLIMRKVYEPHDVFKIVASKARERHILVDDFFENRVLAENLLIAKIPTIFELYIKLQELLNISNAVRNQLMALEIEVEREVIIPRKKMVEIFNYAISLGKKVYLISDMYLPPDLLIEILKENGIENYNGLFDSCEFHTPKVNGLFEIYKNQVSGISYLHIGDNELADGYYASQAGIDSFLIKSGKELFQMSKVGSTLRLVRNENDKVIIGLFISRIFNNPFIFEKENGQIRIEKIEDLVYSAAGPILSCFVEWFTKIIKSDKYNKILLAARDGYLIKKMLQKKQLKYENVVYFYTSRIACITSSISTPTTFYEAMRRNPEIKLSSCMEKRLQLRHVDIPESSSEEEVFGMYKEKILKRSEELKRNYTQYMESVDIGQSEKYLLFDFTSSGTCMKWLSETFNLQLEGAFFMHYDDRNPQRKNLSIKSFLKGNYKSNFWNHYTFFETIVTSPEASVLYFDKYGTPVFENEYRSDHEIDLALHMQKQVLDYYDNYLYLSHGEESSTDLLDVLLKVMDNNVATVLDAKKDILFLYDTYGSGKIRIFE